VRRRTRDIGQIALRLNEDGEISNRYLWGPAVDQILADEQVEWNAGAQDYDIDQILWPLTDHQGTVRDLAEVGSGDTEIVNTYSYDAYGVLLTETAPAVDHLFGFTARPTQTDAGLINCLNRWYDPVIASWITQDPITFQGGDANLYRYCGNDPVNSVDPSGLYDGYWTEVGRTAKGYFWNGPIALASGLYNTIRHPIDTAKGIATAVRHPIQTGAAIKDEIAKKVQTSEGQGEIGFDVAITLTPAGLAAKAKLAKAAKTAKAARAGEVAKAGKLEQFADEAAKISENATRSRGLTPNATRAMAMSRKDALNRLNGLKPLVEKHLKKIAENPASRDVPHWKGEIQTWLRDMEKVIPNVGKKTGTEWQDLINKYKGLLGE